MFLGSCIQLNSSDSIQDNILSAKNLIHGACDAGAQVIFTPEHTPYFPNQKNLDLARESLRSTELILKEFSKLAKERNVWINFALDELDRETTLLLNSSYVINNKGMITKKYSKIHLFNYSNEEEHSESKIYRPGSEIVIAELPWGKLGLSICYDLRFPIQYKMMRKEGAEFFAVASAFTYATGRDHWQVLLQARAIESGCYIFAANQCGSHFSNRKTYGHSLIISPWGKILAEATEKPGFIIAPIFKSEIEEARKKIPSSYFD